MFKIMTLCYVRKEGKILMIHRTKKEGDLHKDKWNGLGGKFEPGETPEECAAREVLEETNGGIKVNSCILKGRITFTDEQPTSLNNSHVYVIVIEDFEGEPLGDSPEGDLEWVPNDQILGLNLWDGDKVFLPWIDKPGFFSAKLCYDGQTLIDHSVEFYN